MYDLLVRGGKVIDGTGGPWQRADVAIRGDRIVGVGRFRPSEAGRVVDVDGLWLVPGLIDAHVHSDILLLTDPEVAEASLRQGVTAHIVGQDGISYAPASEPTMAFFRDYLAGLDGDPRGFRYDWRTVGEYLARFDGATPLNVACLVPHGNVRMEAMGGCFDRPPDEAELRRMQELVAEGLAQGAVGVSTGLIYLPCRYADVRELAAVAAPAAAWGLPLVAHIRTYVPGQVFGALEEMWTVARQTGGPVHVSHFNGVADELLPAVDSARADGIDVTFDSYPYLAGATLLVTLLPDWVTAGGLDAARQRLRDPELRQALTAFLDSPARRWELVRLNGISHPAYAVFEGVTPLEAARRVQQPVGEFLLALLEAEDLHVGMVQQHDWRTEADLRRIMAHPAHMGCSDGIYVGGRPHPRGWGAFARFLAAYAREEGILPLEEMVRHLSSAAARRFGLWDRGMIRPGCAADLCALDLAALRDLATFDDGRRFASGVVHVWVNGRAALFDGRLTGDTPGQALRCQRA